MSQYLRDCLPWIAASLVFAAVVITAALWILGGTGAAPFVYTIF